MLQICHTHSLYVCMSMSMSMYICLWMTAKPVFREGHYLELDVHHSFIE